MKIAIGCDHAGFLLKEKIIEFLKVKGHKVVDFGCYNEESIDYPDYAHPVANHIEENKDSLGILICGSGNGISMSANKHKEVRCALCWNTELAVLAKQHNDANILALPARFITTQEALSIVEAFLESTFEGGRHANRVAKINQI